MQRLIWIVFLAALFFMTVFGFTAYAFGASGGKVEMFTQHAEAYSQSGQAIAVQGSRDFQITAENPQLPPLYQTGYGFFDVWPLLLFLVFAVCAIWFLFYQAGIVGNKYDDDDLVDDSVSAESDDSVHYSSKESDAWKAYYKEEVGVEPFTGSYRERRYN